MSSFEKAKRRYIIVFMVILIPQLIISYLFLIHPDIMDQQMLNSTRGKLLGSIQFQLRLIQAVNCYFYASGTNLNRLWKWLLSIGVAVFFPIQWVAIIVLFVQKPKASIAELSSIGSGVPKAKDPIAARIAPLDPYAEKLNREIDRNSKAK